MLASGQLRTLLRTYLSSATHSRRSSLAPQLSLCLQFLLVLSNGDVFERTIAQRQGSTHHFPACLYHLYDHDVPNQTRQRGFREFSRINQRHLRLARMEKSHRL